MGMTWSLVGPDGQPADDFRFDNHGRFVEDETVATAIALVLDQHLGKWWADPHHGSRVHQLMTGTPSPDMTRELESATREALAPLERDGRIKDITVHVQASENRALVTVTVFDTGQGRPLTMETAR